MIYESNTVMHHSKALCRRVPVTAIVTAWRRIDQTLDTIGRILSCVPEPSEILVHVDGGEVLCSAAIRKAFPEVIIIESIDAIGPGGGRNKLIYLAKNDLVASFDDDSYPIDCDFFLRAVFLFDLFSEAALIGCYICHKHERIKESSKLLEEVGGFVGCGVIYRRGDFLRTSGYVSLPLAYGMEEEDLSLRLLDLNIILLYSPWLRVFHDTELAHHREPEVVAAQIVNAALLAFLRYPFRYWPYGVAQTLNRALWSFRNGRTRGILRGLTLIPGRLWRHRHLRSPVASRALKLKLGLRRVEMVSFDGDC